MKDIREYFKTEEFKKLTDEEISIFGRSILSRNGGYKITGDNYEYYAEKYKFKTMPRRYLENWIARFTYEVRNIIFFNKLEVDFPVRKVLEKIKELRATYPDDVPIKINPYLLAKEVLGLKI